MLKNILLIALGGGVGSVCRYLISLLIGRCADGHFPWGTFVVNVLGCLLIGILLGIFSKAQVANHEMKLLLVTGFCGGFTTFSAFSVESLSLFQSGQVFQAILYVTGSLLIGLLAVWGGYILLK